MTPDPIPIVDCHAHFLDAEVHTYPVFSERNPGFEALVRDYSALPRRYLIFGLGWTTNQIRPWILDLIELFGPARCMYASHMPIARLGYSFQQLYGAYLDVVSDFSGAEKQRLFSDTAIEVYRLSQI